MNKLVLRTADLDAKAEPAMTRTAPWVPEQQCTNASVLASKLTKPVRKRGIAASQALSLAKTVRQQGAAASRVLKTTWQRLPPSCAFPKENRNTVSSMASRRVRVRDDELNNSEMSSKKRRTAEAHVPMPERLLVLGKDAEKQWEQAQKAAHEARRNASVTNVVLSIYRIFTELRNMSSPDAPATCFDSFLSFHQDTVQAITNIEGIQVSVSMVTAVACDEQPPKDATPILQETTLNRAAVQRQSLNHGCNDENRSPSSCTTGSKHTALGSSLKLAKQVLVEAQSWLMEFLWGSVAVRPQQSLGSGVSKSVLVAPEGRRDMTPEDRSTGENGQDGSGNDEKTAHSALGSSLKIAKQILDEAESWFMEFLEAALETGLKTISLKKAWNHRKPSSSSSCPLPLLRRVITWVEVEQSGRGGSNKPAHPKAATIARKLRIKAINH